MLFIDVFEGMDISLDQSMIITNFLMRTVCLTKIHEVYFQTMYSTLKQCLRFNICT